MTACLHSNLEAGFKKAKQEKIPPPRSLPAHRNLPWLFCSNKASRGRGWQAGQEGIASRPPAASPVAGNGIPHLLPDFWIRLDRGPSTSIGKVQIPISLRLLANPPAGCNAILGDLGCPHFPLSVFAGKMEGVCFTDRGMERTQPQCVCLCVCVRPHPCCVCVMEVSPYILNSMLARFFSSRPISGHPRPPAFWFIHIRSLHAGAIGQKPFPHRCDSQARGLNLSTPLGRACQSSGAYS